MRTMTLMLLAVIGCADAAKSPVETTEKTEQDGQQSNLFGDILGATSPAQTKGNATKPQGTVNNAALNNSVANNVPIPLPAPNPNPQPAVDPNATPANNVLKFEAPKGNPYNVTPSANPPANQKPTLVHYQQLLQANPNVKIVQKPTAGNIFTFVHDRFATLGLKKSVDNYRALNGNWPPFADFQRMVKENKTDFPRIQANQLYAYCSQTGAVFVVQK